MITMKIVNLKEHAEFIPTLAVWHHDQWGYLNPDGSIEKRIFSLTFVAVSGDSLLGSASLVPHDMETRMELSPWLASVYVADEHRKRGTGSKLVKHVVREANTFGHRTIYLFTMSDRENFYTRLGWSLFERTDYHGYPVAIMSIETT